MNHDNQESFIQRNFALIPICLIYFLLFMLDYIWRFYFHRM